MRGVTYGTGRVIWKRPFLLTRLMRGVTRTDPAFQKTMQFLLTRLMRGVTIVFICATP